MKARQRVKKRAILGINSDLLAKLFKRACSSPGAQLIKLNKFVFVCISIATIGLGFFMWKLGKASNDNDIEQYSQQHQQSYGPLNNNHNSNYSSYTGNTASNLTPNASNAEMLFGAKTLQNTKLRNFVGYGDIALYDSAVSGTATIYGDMQTNNVKINDTIIYGSAQLHDTDVKNKLSIYGEAFLSNSKINGSSTIFGTIASDNTIFKGDINATTSKFTLLNSQTKGINIQQLNTVIGSKNANKNPQTIRIIGNSIINGDIVFEQGGGIVELGKHAKVNGKIKGALLKRDKKDNAKD